MGLKYRAFSTQTICFLLAVAFSFSLVGCGEIELPSGLKGFSVADITNVAFEASDSNLSEVAPPKVVAQLDEILEQYQPRVDILSPSSSTTIQTTEVEVKLAVEGYALFKDDRLKLGPHLNLMLDNEHYAEIYDLRQSIFVKDLKPGTHTIRVIVEKPWHESFKNPEAFAQTTFNVLTETQDNNPNLNLPLITYNQPSGVYSEEPILLDFYLKGMARNDWQVKVTINEESFTVDEWQPIYLKGFQEGNNLIQLELLDGMGEIINNEFNQPIRLITYDSTSSEQDTLAKLLTDRLSFTEAVAIAKPNYIESINKFESRETTTEDIFSEVPVESENEVIKDIEEPTVEERPVEITSEVTEEITEERENENEANAEAETTEISEVVETTPLDKAARIVSKDKETVVTKTKLETVIEPQPVEEKNVSAKNFSRRDSISTTSIDKNTADSRQDTAKRVEGLTEVPVPEEIEAVEIEDDLTIKAKESDTITIKIPKPKLKVPQWWKDLVVNLQQRFNR